MVRIIELVKEMKDSQERVLEIEKTMKDLEEEKKQLREDLKEKGWQVRRIVHDEATKEELIQFFEDRKLINVAGRSGMEQIILRFDDAISVLKEKHDICVSW